MPRPKIESGSPHSADNVHAVRGRVVKACQRCRLKKCKCDGSTPCTRCTADDAICAYGKHKRSDKTIYRKGYVQMLERQHTQLLTGLQELYRRAQNGQGWDGPPLDPINRGRPLAHKILDALGVLCKDEWEDDDGPDGMSSWQSFEQQSHRGSDILHDHSDTVSPATTMAISPLSVPPPAFPQSTIKAKRPSKYKASRPPTSQPLSTAPLPVLDPYADSYKNLLASDPGHYSSGPQLQTPTPMAPFNLAILENDNLSYDSMEWDMGTDDIFDVSNYQAALPLQAIG